MDYKDKIRKLLALAKSPEPEEAKFALLKARKLMAEHKLSERDLEERNTTVIKRAISETFSKKANSWIVVSMHQDDGIGASRLLRACNEMDAFEKKYQTAILYGSSKNATDAMRENLKGICDFEVRLPVDRAPRGRREEQLRMASNQGAEIAWLVMAATCHETFGYGRDRLARLKQNSMNNYKQYLEWEKEDKDLALDRLRRCVQDALKEDLRVTDTDDRKGMLSTPGRGPSVYETAAVYSEIFRRARAARAVAPLAVYSAAKYDETMTAARKRASVMLGL